MAETFTESEAQIVAHMADANIPALLATLIHFTGTADHLDAFPVPVTDVSTWGDENGGISPEKNRPRRGRWRRTF